MEELLGLQPAEGLQRYPIRWVGGCAGGGGGMRKAWERLGMRREGQEEVKLERALDFGPRTWEMI